MSETPLPVAPENGRWWQAADHRLLMWFLVPYTVLRLAQAKTTTLMSVDGGYYVDVAKHIRDGLGLQTNLSVFHFGYTHFPHPSSVYPLWPTLLGLIAKVAPLEAAAHWVPTILSIIAVFLMYLWGRRMWPEPVLPSVLPGLHAGHGFAVALGLHREWMLFTALPYTEALAWALLAAFLLRAATLGGSTRWQWGVESGVWIALLFLTRAQFLVVHFAFAGAQVLRVLLGPDRRRGLVQLLITQAIAAGVMAAWFGYLRTFLYAPGLSALLRFDQHRVSELLPELEVIVSTGTAWETLVDRLRGAKIAFDDLSRDGYETAYNAIHWALPMAGCLAVAQLWAARTQPWRDRLQAWRANPALFYWAFVLALAVGGMLSVHLVHKNFNGSWYFGRRQGLMSLPAFVLALGWMMRQKDAFGKNAGAVILVATLWSGGHALAAHGIQPVGPHKGPDPHDHIVAWLRAVERSQGPITVAMDDDTCKRMGYRTDHVGYHWIEQRTSYADLLKITDTLGAKYLILRQDSKDWRVLTDNPTDFALRFEPLPVRPNRMHVYKRRTTPATPQE
jgi:hypothetical protein